jgi:hypothetical protein
MGIAALVAVLGFTVLLAVVHVTRAPAGGQLLLPDLDQDVPTNVSTRAVGDGYALGFDSSVYNHGPGPLRLRATRPKGSDAMVADQMIRDAEGEWASSLANVGRVQYVDAFGHEHWHYMQFQRYELYSTAEAGVQVGDRKQGFCLAGLYAPRRCALGERGLRAIELGLSPGKRDAYKSFVEGQEIPIDPRTTPSGTYVLVHRTDLPRDNAASPLSEVTTANNAASVRLALTWAAEGSEPPAVEVLESCPDTWDCPAGSGRPIVGPPAPPQGAASLPAAARFAAPRAMSGRQAAILSRQALQRRFPSAPRRLAVDCRRSSPSRFACRAGWRRRGVSYRGRLTVWHGSRDSYYRARVTRRPRDCGARSCVRRFSRAGVA